MSQFTNFHTFHTCGVVRCGRCGEYTQKPSTTPLRLYRAWCGGGVKRIQFKVWRF
jgi:hypothetical protein